MFSNNENLKNFVSDDLNCMIHSQRFIPFTHNLQFSISFFLGKNKTPPAVTFQTIRILTDDENVNHKNNTLGKVLRYKTCGNSADAEIIYLGIVGSALAQILFNNGKELRCAAYCTKDGGIKIKIFLNNV